MYEVMKERDLSWSQVNAASDDRCANATRTASWEEFHIRKVDAAAPSSEKERWTLVKSKVAAGNEVLRQDRH